MESIFWILFFSLFASFASAFPAAAADKPPAGTAKVSKVAVDTPDVDTDGSGCRQGSVSAAFSQDNSIMTIIFDEFAAAIGPNAGTLKKRALCRVNVTLSSPGWAFDVQTVDFRGYVKLAKGVDASVLTRWKWIDSNGNDLEGKGNAQKKLSGPFEDDILIHKDGEASSDKQSPCSKSTARFQITLSASLSATNTSVTGLVRGDSVDTKFGEIMNLAWRKC